MHKEKSAFTLIELMVAMGIIGVLVTLSLLGITIVQTSLRDTQRRDGLNAVRLAVEGYYTTNTSYPADSMVTIDTGGNAMNVGSQTVTLNGPARACAVGVTTVDSSCTIYCYAPKLNNTTYDIGALLEGGWTQLGNAGGAGCGLTDRIPFE